MPKWEYEERQARLRFLCKVSPISNFLHSHDDRFAAQIVFGALDFSPLRHSPALARHHNYTKNPPEWAEKLGDFAAHGLYRVI